MFTQALVVALLSVSARACTGTITSLTDVAAAVACTTINVNGFSVPAGSTFSLALLAGTTVNILGDISFGTKNWAGPLFSITGTNVTFNGNDHTFNGQGSFYWDGHGSSSGTLKPRPMMKFVLSLSPPFLPLRSVPPLFAPPPASLLHTSISNIFNPCSTNFLRYRVKTSGLFTNLKILNSPAQVFSVDNAAPLTISAITIDDSLGDSANAASAGKPAGANTDGFDVGNQAPLTISGCTVKNQDDCIAINSGAGVTFTGNHCSGGHGISIGSIDTGDIVSNITISNNVITSGANGLRIKTIATAMGASVSGITYSGNTVSNVTGFGVLIDQSYPSTLGTPGNGVVISGINFVGTNTLTIPSGITPVAVNCGSTSCQGTWNWAGLKVSGGAANKINYKGITGFP
ncbi:polygalacturonase [Mycena albidolilacea]|uniref:endo-polygalacturonase n=1 Tax=Mycena albidolilacea TaxID=1033008 RepID=A0AAD7E7G1_9AGAR|nr:polygalacturonase [Mycena albidolilacea]